MSTMRHSITLPLVLAGFATGAVIAAEPETIARYTAEYEVETDGHHVANAEFRVEENADGYVFSSSARARGVLRMIRPDPAVDRSEFSLVDGRIVPGTFRYEDGSRKGEDNFSVVFDRAAGEVRINTAGGTETLPLEAGILDRGSVQVALMRDLAACRLPGPYRYVDDDGIGEYRFERVDGLAAETGIGTLDTVRFSQQREGSSRQTIFWLAPELAFLPVRIDQFRNGELKTSFTLDDVEGLERKPSACSGFR
jgi:Protein of unknown function (DUF3108)